jgi:hypothetical protein
LSDETAYWGRLSEAIGDVLKARPKEA